MTATIEKNLNECDRSVVLLVYDSLDKEGRDDGLSVDGSAFSVPARVHPLRLDRRLIMLRGPYDGLLHTQTELVQETAQMRTMVGTAEEVLDDFRHAFADPRVPEKPERLRCLDV